MFCIIVDRASCYFLTEEKVKIPLEQDDHEFWQLNPTTDVSSEIKQLESMAPSDDASGSEQANLDSTYSSIRPPSLITNKASSLQAGSSEPPLTAEAKTVWGDDGIVDSSLKKRRGRAAPPGRCQSCNRAETPEWRRGPDGARTLCNACGLR